VLGAQEGEGVIPRRVIGLDPGLGHTGIATLDLDEAGRIIRAEPLVIHGSKTNIPGLAFLRSYVAQNNDPATTLICVEEPAGVMFGNHAAKHVLAGGVLAGRFTGWAMALGYQVETASAQEWRTGLGCRGTVAEKADAAVADMVRLRIPSWPKVSNGHARDAAGVALYCLERMKLRARGVPA
jgi:Holliday junction resolvasome RuvABC endonuclease subunit